jgi:hypothetical protein
MTKSPWGYHNSPEGTEKKVFLVSFTDALMFVGMCTVLGGFAALGYQCLLWLRQGTWTPMSINEVLSVDPSLLASMEWRGVAVIVEWALALPLSGGLVLAGIGVALLGARLAAR